MPNPLFLCPGRFRLRPGATIGALQLRSPRYRTSAILLVLAGLYSCAAPAPDQGIQDLATAGSAHFQSDFSVFMVPASGADADAEFIDRSTSELTEMSRQLAQMFAASETQDVNIVVGGPNSAKTTAVLVAAADLLAGRTLDKLSVLFIGDAGDIDKARAAIASIGGTLEISPY